MKPTFFRTWGVGTSSESAFLNAIYNEQKLHPDLSQELSKMTCKRIPLPRNMRAGDLELKFILTVLAESCENIRTLTKSEEKNKQWFYSHFKDKSKYYLRWFKNTIKDKKCLAIVEKREADKIYYRFIGHAKYEMNEEDELSDVESDIDSECELESDFSSLSISHNNLNETFSNLSLSKNK